MNIGRIQFSWLEVHCVAKTVLGKSPFEEGDNNDDIKKTRRCVAEMLLKHPFEKYKIGSFLQAFGVTKMKQRSKPPPTCSNSSTYHHPEIDPILHFLFAIYQDDLRQVRFATSIPLLT